MDQQPPIFETKQSLGARCIPCLCDNPIDDLLPSFWTNTRVYFYIDTLFISDGCCRWVVRYKCSLNDHYQADDLLQRFLSNKSHWQVISPIFDDRRHFAWTNTHCRHDHYQVCKVPVANDWYTRVLQPGQVPGPGPGPDPEHRYGYDSSGRVGHRVWKKIGFGYPYKPKPGLDPTRQLATSQDFKIFVFRL
jgi:hypothetical protein